MAKSYEDIGKDAVEFITKGFPNSGAFKLISETKTPNGVSVKATGSRSFEFKDKDNVDEKISGEVEPKFKQGDVEFSGKLTTGGDFEGGVAIDNLGTKGSKVSFTATQSDRDGASVKGSVAFKNDQFTTKAGLKFPFKTSTHANWNGEVTFRHENLHAGVDLRYDQPLPGPEDKEKLTDRKLYNIKGGYIANDQQFVISFENQVNKDKKTSKDHPFLSLFNVNYLYALTSAIKVGFGATVERQNLKGTELHTSAEYKVDKDTVVKEKFSVVNASAADDREFRLALALKQNVSDRVNVTVGADVNARAILGTGKSTLGATKPHSFGFEVKFQ